MFFFSLSLSASGGFLLLHCRATTAETRTFASMLPNTIRALALYVTSHRGVFRHCPRHLPLFFSPLSSQWERTCLCEMSSDCQYTGRVARSEDPVGRAHRKFPTVVSFRGTRRRHGQQQKEKEILASYIAVQQRNVYSKLFLDPLCAMRREGPYEFSVV